MLLLGNLTDLLKITLRIVHKSLIVVLYEHLIGAQRLRLADIQRGGLDLLFALDIAARILTQLLLLYLLLLLVLNLGETHFFALQNHGLEPLLALARTAIIMRVARANQIAHQVPIGAVGGRDHLQIEWKLQNDLKRVQYNKVIIGQPMVVRVIAKGVDLGLYGQRGLDHVQFVVGPALASLHFDVTSQLDEGRVGLVKKRPRHDDILHFGGF